MAQEKAMTAERRAIAAAVERLVAAKMKIATDLARLFGQPDPFTTDADRVARRKAEARAPERCGSEIVAAPARGPMRAFTPLAVTPKENGAYEIAAIGHLGRDAARKADAFDLMERQAQRRAGSAYRPLFTAGQAEAGRRYAELVERHDASGIKLSSIEGRTGGAGGAGALDVADLRLSESRRLDRLHAAIGGEVVFKTVVDHDGNVLKPGLDTRGLVSLVCCGGLTVSQVIKRCGRSPYGDLRAEVRSALVAALARMSDL